MTSNDAFGRDLSRWLLEDGEHRVPDHLGEVLVLTAATRQRSWWSSPERWLPMDSANQLQTPTTVPVMRILLIGLLILALAASIAVVGSQRAPVPAPFGLAKNGVVTIEDGGDVYVADPDGTDRRPVLSGGTNDYGTSFSRDGTQLFFVRGVPGDDVLGQPFVANVDGSDPRPLTEEPLSGLSWYEASPTGERVVFVHMVDGRQVLSIADTGAPASLRRLPVPVALEVDPTVMWRPPSGDELVFTARPNGDDGSSVGLYRIRPDGSGFAAIAPVATTEWAYLGLDVAPDGEQAAYWQYDPDASTDGFGASVHMVDLDTGKDRIVRFVDDLADEAELRFSPDGSTGVIVRCPDDRCRLHVVPLDPVGAPRAVGPEVPADQRARGHGFSPDGTKVVLHMDGRSPLLIDPSTGGETPWEATAQVFGSWQRLAP